MSLKLGLNLGYWGIGPQGDEATEIVLAAERAGFDSVWAAESYGSDAVSVLAYLAAKTETIQLGAAILQVPARQPAAAAMAGVTIDALSGGRMIFGFGPSGPQVSEGWYGVPYEKPWGRTREYVEIVKEIVAREGKLEHEGKHFTLPLREGEGVTGQGKALKLNIHPVRSEIPVYLGAIGRKSVELAAEIADGWIPVFFSARRIAMFREWLGEGFRAGGRSGQAFDIMPMVPVVIGDDAAACRALVKPRLALYVGGMGARGRNFYNDIARRYGYEDAARRIQDLYLGGRKDEAAAAVPDALVDEVALCGPRERVREHLAEWTGAGVTTMMVAGDTAAIRTMAELTL
jgi:F420-dependent oxidoreductase-like protein